MLHLLKDRWRPLTALSLAAGLCLGAGGVATSATWADTSYASAAATTGTVGLRVNGTVNATTGARYVVPMPAGKYEPGTSRTGTFTLKNTGNLAVKLSMRTAISGTNNGLTNALTLRVTTDGTQRYNGAARTAAFSGITLAAGATTTVAFTVTAPANLNLNLRGKSEKLFFDFTATNTAAA